VIVGRRARLRTAVELEDEGEELARIESLWRKSYALELARGMRARDARRVATQSLAAQLGKSCRRVQQLRKRFAQEFEPHIQPKIEGGPDIDFKALRRMLTAEEHELVRTLRGPPALMLIGRLLAGATAQRRVVQLERELKSLKTQTAAEGVASGYSASSAKRIPRRKPHISA
jgi:hypothetical protein